MEKVVISLGGSLLVPDQINDNYVKKFQKLLSRFNNHKFVIVTGGGKTARTYIKALNRQGISKRTQSLIGIRITRLNAWALINLFKSGCAKVIPKSIKEVKNLLNKNRVVIAGGLRYVPDNTSDGTAASIAKAIGADLINMTNVNGLYDKDPKLKGAKLINEISFSDFDKKIKKLKYKPGQHFILDQHASDIIKKNKITTYIVGPNLKNIEKLLKGKAFLGTTIS